jgi:hypothetical protein
MLEMRSATLERILNPVCFASIGKNALIASVIALLPTIALAVPSEDTGTEDEPSRHIVEQRILSQPARILEQMKGSVCGTGPLYAGKVDDPVFVTSLYKPACTITLAPPGPR